jgi:16S rRNA (guanine527-N7)-methyltransferase
MERSGPAINADSSRVCNGGEDAKVTTLRQRKCSLGKSVTAGGQTCEDALSDLVTGAAEIGIQLVGPQARAFITYCSLLLERNRQVNLTGVRTSEGVMKTLFLDSLTLLLALPPEWRSKGITLCDVGSGAGIPGLPLKIICGSWQLALIESVGKKATFLKEIVERLALDNIEVVNARAETFAAGAGARDSMDVCCARAVGSLPSLIELCAPLVRRGGVLVFPRSGVLAAEIEAASTAARHLRVRPRPVVAIPASLGLGENRGLVVYEKVGETPSEFPRRVGLATSKPLL